MARPNQNLKSGDKKGSERSQICIEVEEHVSTLDTKELREEWTDPGEPHIVELRVNPFRAQLPQKPHITGGIFQEISIYSE